MNERKATSASTRHHQQTATSAWSVTSASAEWCDAERGGAAGGNYRDYRKVRKLRMLTGFCANPRNNLLHNAT